MWDVGGQSSIRKYWKGYYPNTKAVVFVVDSSDKDRINVVKEEMFLLLQVFIF
jgi:ADP-ribosylation factor-like protein 1